MSLTLAQLHALDLPALWASLSAEAQARIGVLAIRLEVANQVAEDGGFDTSERDRIEAGAIAANVLTEAPEAVWQALPDLLPIEYDDLYPLWTALGDPRVGDKVEAITVHGMQGRRIPRKVGWTWVVREHRGGGWVELQGARDLNSRKEGASPAWEFWTVPQVEAERRRRHPDQFLEAYPSPR